MDDFPRTRGLLLLFFRGVITDPLLCLRVDLSSYHLQGRLVEAEADVAVESHEADHLGDYQAGHYCQGDCDPPRRVLGGDGHPNAFAHVDE